LLSAPALGRTSPSAIGWIVDGFVRSLARTPVPQFLLSDLGGDPSVKALKINDLTARIAA
jgi:hypothetical protein